MNEQVHECQASITGRLPCLAPVEFNCREFGAVCLTHSHVRGCCQPVFYDEEGDVWGEEVVSGTDFNIQQKALHRLAKFAGWPHRSQLYRFSDGEKRELLELAERTPDRELLAIRNFGPGLLTVVRNLAPYRGETTRNAVLSEREVATVLAALRNWQTDSINEDLAEAFAGHFEEHKPLDDDEIDALCERLNLGAP